MIGYEISERDRMVYFYHHDGGSAGGLGFSTVGRQGINYDIRRIAEHTRDGLCSALVIARDELIERGLIEDQG